ncbi:MAG: NAD(P)/FAD-dependent oxidoreductase, partial [Polyangiaceae bacterium]|nr:NAD(P)/FAD-dependent oxidoreductase [Polyangiaceae bacterium]
MTQARDDFDVIVIGTGIGGSAAAVSLAHARKRVLVLEKNKRIGGSCSYYEKEGFHVDMGTHLFCRAEKGPLGDVLRRVGAPGAVTFKRAFPGVLRGFDFDVTLSPSMLANSLSLVEAVRQANIPVAELPKAIRFFRTILTMRPREIEALDRVSMYEFILRYTQDPHIYILFNFLLGLYFILSPKDVSAGEAIWSFQRFMKDHALSYPRGGASAIPEAYLRIARRYGAKVHTRAGVKKVIVENGRTRGVETEDGTIHRAPVVISTAGLRDAVRMAGTEHFSSTFLDRVKTLKGSQIAVQAKIGLRRPVIDAAWVVGGSPLRFPPGEPTIETFNGYYDSVARGKVGAGVPIYCPIP